MGFINFEELEKEIISLEDKFTVDEREFLMNIIQKRIREDKVKSKQKELMGETMNLVKGKFLGGSL